MRQFDTLNHADFSSETGVLTITSTENPLTGMSVKIEGGYVALSLRYGPLEIALRPRLQELTRVLARLRPVEGLQTTRQVGTGQAFLGVGLSVEGDLLLRPTIVADATGHWGINLALNSASKTRLFDLLEITPE